MKDYNFLLNQLKVTGSYRQLPTVTHHGNRIEKDGQIMLNLSSNDYLGLASCADLQKAFLEEWQEQTLLLYLNGRIILFHSLCC